MPAKHPVVIELRALDRATKNIRKLKGRFSELTRPIRKVNNQARLLRQEFLFLDRASRRLASTGRTLTTRLTLPIGLLGAGILKAGADFQKGMNRVEAKLGDKASLEGLTRLTEQAKELGASTQFSATEAASGMAFLAQAGWDVEDIYKAIPDVLSLAASSEIDLARAADIASNVMGAFKIEAGQMGMVADVLAKATSSSNINMEQLAESMTKAAPVAKTFGLSVQETAATVGLLGNIGIQGSEAGTSLRTAFLNLSAPTSTARLMLKKLNVQVTDNKGDLLNFTQIMNNLGSSLSRFGKSTQLQVMKEVFGKRAISGASELLSQATEIGKDGKNSIERFTSALIDSQGAAQKMQGIMMKGATGEVIKLRSALEGLFIAISESGILGAFTSLIQSLTNFVQKLSKTNPELLKWGTILLGVLATLGPLLISLSLLVKAFAILATPLSFLKALGISGMFLHVNFVFSKMVGILSLLKIGFSSLGSAILVAGKSLLALFGSTPLGWLIAAGAALFVIWKNFDRIKAILKNLFSFDFKEALKETVGLFKDMTKGIGDFFGFGEKSPTLGADLKPSGSSSPVKQAIEINRQQKDLSASIDFKNVIPGTKIVTDGFDSQSIAFNLGPMMDGLHG